MALFSLFIFQKWGKKTFIILSLCILSIIALSYTRIELSQENLASLESRKLLTTDALTRITGFSLPEHLMGKGYGSVQGELLKEFSPKYLAYEQIDYIPDRVHNFFLDTYIQTGVIGLLFFFGIFCIFPVFLILRSRDILVRSLGLIALIHFSIQVFGFYDPSNLLYGSLLFVLLIRAIESSRASHV